MMFVEQHSEHSRLNLIVRNTLSSQFKFTLYFYVIQILQDMADFLLQNVTSKTSNLVIISYRKSSQYFVDFMFHGLVLSN